MNWFRRTLLLFPLLLCCSLAHAQQLDPKAEATQKADEIWLGRIDAGKYAESWKEASPSFQSVLTQDKWTAALESTRTPLGALRSRRLVSATYSKSLPGVPDGEYEVLIYATAFEHKAVANETVISRMEKDGSWRVAGYYIR